MRMLQALMFAFLAPCAVGFSQTGPIFSLMPLPRQVSVGTGELSIQREFRLQLKADPKDPLVLSAAHRALHSLEIATGMSFPVEPVTEASRGARGSLLVVVHSVCEPRVGADESYTLNISPEGARLEAATSLGALRGLATFRQLIQRDGKRVFLPALAIEDSPGYPWRGLMIDVARHFVSIDVLERNLDAMELVKMNVLHLHLSDNEGFRVESKVYPKLQGEGSNGEYYTQAQIRDLLRYAELRGIVVVPEFDMPSHAKSWLAGYPELSSSPGPFKPGILTYEGLTPSSTLSEIQAALETVKVPALDPTRESTYQFLDQLISEMAGLFRSPYLHIGADENNGAIWLANPGIVAFMQANHLADASALQAYFVARVQAIVEKHGKQMVAWEEAFAADQSKNAIFQAWLPFPKPDLLSSPMGNGNKVLVSRGFYLDLFYPAHAHYLNDALPAGVSAPANPSILGGEAAMWSELADGTNIEARIWPRTGAIAERLWSTQSSLDVPGMYRRLFQLSAELDREGVHNLVDYDVQVKRIAGNLPVEPVKTLLDVLTPIKGYKRLRAAGVRRALGADPNAPFNSVADVVLVDSAAKHAFRDALASYLKSHDEISERSLRALLMEWSHNDSLLPQYFAQSDDLKAESGHSKQLADLAGAALRALDQMHGGSALSAAELAADDALLKAADADEGETEIAVLPEFEALFHGALTPEPSSYPLF